MTVHFTADTHFGHANIIRHCSRPFGSVDEMYEAIMATWNAVVKPGDTVWHVGDFAAVKDHARYFDRLNGTKHWSTGTTT